MYFPERDHPGKNKKEARILRNVGPSTITERCRVDEGKPDRIAGQFQEPWRPLRAPMRYKTYDKLAMPIEDIYHEINDKNLLRRPPPLRGKAGRDKGKFCKYHEEREHATADYVDL